jgi:hypothetical protein
MKKKSNSSVKIIDHEGFPKNDVRYILENRRFNENYCFLCAEPLNEKNTTSEHVIPRWAQKRFDLWHQKITLLNGSSIPYRYLTVPCCEKCNKGQLQPIESLVSSAVIEGSDAVRKLGNKVIFLWLSKIFFGLLYKELFLSFDRKDLESKKIFEPELIKDYEGLMFFLQEVRGKIETVDFCPGSIFVFKTKKYDNIKLQWDFTDNIDFWIIGIRMGSVGIIASLGDGGAQNAVDSLDHLMDYCLNRDQFRELCAVVSYRSTLATRVPKHISINGPEDEVIKTYQLPLMGYSMKPLFEDWDFDVYAKHLHHFTGLSINEIRPNSNSIRSFIYDEFGNLQSSN